MPTYYELLTTDLSTLTTAAEQWEHMATKRFHDLEGVYRRDVHGISMGSTWTGLSAQAASKRFDITLTEFQKAQTEAKAVASLLREAHSGFTSLRRQLEHAREDAIKAGMKVSDQGEVSFDISKLTEADHMAMVHDPDYRNGIHEAVASWQLVINQCLKDGDKADEDVQIALQNVVMDGDISDGTVTGFNGQAHGHIDQNQGKDADTKTDGWPKMGFTVSGAKYGKEGSLKAYIDMFHDTGKATVTDGDMKLAWVGDVYGGGRATANYGFTEQGIAGKAEVSLGVRGLTEGRAEYGPWIGGYVRGDGFVGGEMGATGKVTKKEVLVKAKAFAGGKIGGATGFEVAGIGIGGTAEGWAGPGFEAWGGWKKDDNGVYRLDADAGASPIVGGSLGLEITVDPHKLSECAGDLADAVGDGTKVIGHGATSLRDTITGWFD
ncbi:hypothetical protein ACFYM2_01445 [Streptomyces sp. NPDC006711]|uniref:hypothetical protein n=1 Tax=Streptomyces sp. NPDC006711 TaxID=3364762 RepID=UPI0036B03314